MSYRVIAIWNGDGRVERVPAGYGLGWVGHGRVSFRETDSTRSLVQPGCASQSVTRIQLSK